MNGDDGLVTTSTQSLASWLETQIAEDEAGWAVNVVNPASGVWPNARTHDGGQTWMALHFDGEREIQPDRYEAYRWEWERQKARPDTVRGLAECESRRKIIELHRGPNKFAEPVCRICSEGYGWQGRTEDDPCPTLRALALPYQDRGGFREDWR